MIFEIVCTHCYHGLSALAYYILTPTLNQSYYCISHLIYQNVNVIFQIRLLFSKPSIWTLSSATKTNLTSSKISSWLTSHRWRCSLMAMSLWNAAYIIYYIYFVSSQIHFLQGDLWSFYTSISYVFKLPTESVFSFW